MTAQELGANLRPLHRWSMVARGAAVAAVILLAGVGTVMAVDRIRGAPVGSPSRVEALVLTADDERVYALTECLRSRGWEVEDPRTEDGSGHVVPGFSTILEDPTEHDAFNADVVDCSRDVGIPVDITGD
jgi:hypothetical protein